MPKAPNASKHHKKGKAHGSPVVLKGSKKKPVITNPHAPKRPLSAFMYFCTEWEGRIREQNPEASSIEIGKMIGAKWKTLGNADREYYLKQAASDKERYDIEMSLLVDPKDLSEDEAQVRPRPTKELAQ